MADLVLVAADGYGVSGSARGDDFMRRTGVQDNLGYHGYVGRNPKMNAAFIATGAGVKIGAKIGLIENIDIAPTIARILGAEMPGAAGKVLTHILQ